MSKKIKNPLAVLLGVSLKYLRGTENADIVAKKLGMAESAYRMIESGNANLNPNKAIFVVNSDSFQNLRFEKLCKILVETQILDSFKDSEDQIRNGLNEIFKEDSELKNIFIRNGYDLNTVMEKQKLKLFYSNPSVLKDILDYLKHPFSLDVQNLENSLIKSAKEAPCIMQPLMKPSLKHLREQIDEIKEIANLQEDVQKISSEITTIKNSKLGYLIHTATEWRNSKNFISTIGILKHYENFSNKEIILSFLDNILQIKNNKAFENLTYIIASNDSIEKILPHCEKFKLIVKNAILKENIIDDNEIEFIIEKINFHKINLSSPCIEEAHKDFINEEVTEYWLYKDSDFKYSFKTISVTPKLLFNNNQINIADSNNDILEYLVRSVEEAEKDWDFAEILMNNSKKII